MRYNLYCAWVQFPLQIFTYWCKKGSPAEISEAQSREDGDLINYASVYIRVYISVIYLAERQGSNFFRCPKDFQVSSHGAKYSFCYHYKKHTWFLRLWSIFCSGVDRHVTHCMHWGTLKTPVSAGESQPVSLSCSYSPSPCNLMSCSWDRPCSWVGHLPASSCPSPHQQQGCPMPSMQPCHVILMDK